MEEKILELSKKGYSYSQIKKELGCSKGTISYHLGKNQKIKTLNRQTRRRASNVRDVIYRKLDRYFNRNEDKIIRHSKRDKQLYNQAYLKITSSPFCYITKRKIDLLDKTSYNLDHISPFSISKDNSLDNLGLTCFEANHSKYDFTLEKYISLCKEVLENNGYLVTFVKYF